MQKLFAYDIIKVVFIFLGPQSSDISPFDRIVKFFTITLITCFYDKKNTMKILIVFQEN